MLKRLLLLTLISSYTYTQQNNNTNTNSTVDIANQQLSNWSETMKFGISDQRLGVVKKIRFDKNSNAITLLEESFGNEVNQVVKEEIIFSLIDLKHSGNTEFWSDLFENETNFVVLQRAAYAVELMDIPVANPLFQNLTNYQNETPAMRFNAAAVQALGKLKYTEALPIITEIATNNTNHQDLRGAAVVALGMYQDDSLIPLLQKFLTNESESRLIRRYSALAIGRTENPQAFDILSPIAMNEKEEQTVRLNSITGLGYIANNPELIPVLENLTRSDNTSVRTEAIKSLGRLKSESSKEILEYKIKNDPEAIVRREAQNALKEIIPEENSTSETNTK